MSFCLTGRIVYEIMEGQNQKRKAVADDHEGLDSKKRLKVIDDSSVKAEECPVKVISFPEKVLLTVVAV